MNQPHSIVSIVNAYDDGKSTGIVRRLVPGGILGPSDVRKLQLAQFEFCGGDPSTIRLFDFRFRSHSPKTLEEIKAISQGQIPNTSLGGILRAVPVGVRRLVEVGLAHIVQTAGFAEICLEDFSFANLIYAGLAGLNGNDLQAAESIVRHELGLQDMVLLNSRENLYLCGLTETGEFLPSEASIVDYEGPAPIYEIFLSPQPPAPDLLSDFAAQRGFEAKIAFMRSHFSATPSLALPARDAILNADLVVYSAGTQHSSLYPTYLTRGLADALCRSQAYKVMITNIRNDNEIPEFRAADIVRQAVFYLNEKGRHAFEPRTLVDALVVNDPGGGGEAGLIRPNRTQLERLGIAEIRFVQDLEDSSPSNRGRHNSDRLAQIVFQTHRAGQSHFAAAREVLSSGPLAFDLDDTLFVDRRRLLLGGRTGRDLDVDATNVSLILELLRKGFRLALISGNDFNVVKANFLQELRATAGGSPQALGGLAVYADGATTKHRFSVEADAFSPIRSYNERHCIAPEHRSLIGALLDAELARLGAKFPTLDDLHRHYDPQLFAYECLPTSHFVRGEHSQMVIKPVPSEWHARADGEVHDERKAVAESLLAAFGKLGLLERYSVLLRGWGSIEVQSRSVDKFTALSDFLSESGASLPEVVYFGNELDPRDGNDFPVAQHGASVIAVSQEEASLPPLPNVVYGGHRGTASTGLHLEGMLELYESELERVRSGGAAPEAPVTVLYMNRLLKRRFEAEHAQIARHPLLENEFLKRALAAAAGVAASK